MEDLKDQYNDDYRQKSVYNVIMVNNLLIKTLEKVFVPFKISLAQFNVLMVIKHQSPSNGINQVEISNKLITGTANIAKLLEKLYQNELITREVMESDRRHNLIKITQKGSDLLDKIWIVYKKEIDKITKILKKEERIALCEILDKWKECLR